MKLRRYRFDVVSKETGDEWHEYHWQHDPTESIGAMSARLEREIEVRRHETPRKFEASRYLVGTCPEAVEDWEVAR